MAVDDQFVFRPLSDDDLFMMHAWLNEPGVVRWWEGEDVSMQAVIADYSPNRPDRDSTEHWIAELDGGPVGWICCWHVLDGLSESGPWFHHGVTPTAAGIDYLVAAPDQRGQGVGSAMIRTFALDIVFGRHPEWTQAAAGPYTANEASCRALEKAGFRFAASIQHDDDEDEGPCSLMILDRDNLTS